MANVGVLVERLGTEHALLGELAAERKRVAHDTPLQASEHCTLVWMWTSDGSSGLLGNRVLLNVSLTGTGLLKLLKYHIQSI